MFNKTGACLDLKNKPFKFSSFFLLLIFSGLAFSESTSLLDRIFYPKYIGPLKFDKKIDFKDETGAVSYGYSVQAPQQAFLTIYYYPLDEKFDENTRKEYLKGLFHQSKESINTRFENVKLISEGGYEDPKTKNIFLRAIFEADINGSRQSTVIYTMFDKNNLLKIRGTYPKGFDHKDHLQGYLDEIMNHIVVEPGIIVDQHIFENHNENSRAAWLAYGMAKLQWSLENEGMFHTFDEEVHARTMVSNIWKEFKEKEIKNDIYLDTLVKIQKNGFLREYIWDFYRKTYWQNPADLEMVKYSQWKKNNLKKHNPIENVGIYIR